MKFAKGVTQDEIDDAAEQIRRVVGIAPKPLRKAVPGGLLSVRDVCDLLQIRRTKLYSLIEAGRLHPIKLGARSLRFEREDVDAYTKGCIDGGNRTIRRVVGGFLRPVARPKAAPRPTTQPRANEERRDGVRTRATRTRVPSGW